jgi:hypothetical protein
MVNNLKKPVFQNSLFVRKTADLRLAIFILPGLQKINHYGPISLFSSIIRGLSVKGEHLSSRLGKSEEEPGPVSLLDEDKSLDRSG